jgi:antitoxin component of MazEF toxin-antitoxin module
MTVFTLQLSDKSTVILPAELARQAGLEEGDSVEAVVTPEGLTLVSIRDDAETWRTLERRLRYQAAALELMDADRRDEAYWHIVDPMFKDLERDVSAE